MTPASWDCFTDSDVPIERTVRNHDSLSAGFWDSQDSVISVSDGQTVFSALLLLSSMFEQYFSNKITLVKIHVVIIICSRMQQNVYYQKYWNG